MRRNSAISTCLLAMLLFTACTVPHPPMQTQPPPTATATQFIGIVPVTPLAPEGSPSPTPSATLPPFAPAVYQILRAAVDIEALNLRKGPGYLFDSINVYAKGQKVNVIAQEPDGDWVFVQTPDFRAGWMNAHYLLPEGSFSSVPAIMPVGFLVIQGHVYTHNRQTASLISVAIVPEGSKDTALQDIAITNERGEWFIFLPATFEGNWTLSVDAYSPQSSAVNASGVLDGSFPAPQTITLPVSAATLIDFYLEP